MGTIKFHPIALQHHFEQIYEWLKEEDEGSNKGFYSQIEIIKKSFQKKRISSLCFTELTIGFATWYIDKKIATINIFEINPHFRKQKNAKILFDNLVQMFLKEDIYIIRLLYSNIESKHFWKHLGFIEFPKNSSACNQSNRELYKIIVPNLDSNTENHSYETIEIWDLGKHSYSAHAPTHKWSLQFKGVSRDLLFPIISPCNLDGTLRWQKEGSFNRCNRIKDFTFLCDNSYLIIDNVT
jgi:uncharacterized protein with PQ loop repeat